MKTNQKESQQKFNVGLDAAVIPTVADERYLKQLISFPIANKFNTHPEKINDVVSEIYAGIKERFELIKRKTV